MNALLPYDGKIYDSYPGNLRPSQDLRVIYKTFKGWTEDITNIKEYDKLPKNCKEYIEFIEKQLNVKVSLVSVGPERTQNIYRTEF